MNENLYHVKHLCECGVMYSHSQAERDEHRGHACIDIPTEPHSSEGAIVRKIIRDYAIMQDYLSRRK